MKSDHDLSQSLPKLYNFFSFYELCHETTCFMLCKNEGAADQHLCVDYIDRTIPLLSKSEISTF